MVIDKIIEISIVYGPKLLLAIVTLLVGLKIIKIVANIVNKALEKASVEETLARFAVSMVGMGLKILLLVSVASMIGIETTSFVAILGGMSLAIGLAFQGTLANFAGGALILVLKPYVVGDVITTQGYTGKVDQIQVFSTILHTPDGQTVILPNGLISNADIVNITKLGKRRVDLSIGISYDSDIKKAKEIIQKVMESNKKVLSDPAPSVSVAELGDNAVVFGVKPWSTAEDYWDVYGQVQEAVKYEFDKQGIGMPFPQREVYVHNVK